MLPSLEHGITECPQKLLNYFQGHSSTYIVIFKDICVLENMAHFRSKGINEGHLTVSIL